jgi:anti-repressor protein
MDELVKIGSNRLGGATVQTVNARDLHTFLEVGSAFKDWIVRRVEDYGFSEGKDFCSFLSESSGGRPAREYAISIDMAKELSMVERNDRGKEARRYFIECERVAKAAPSIDVRNPATLTTIALQLISVNKELAEKVEELTPKAAAHDRIAESFGSTNRRTAAKNLGIPPLTLNRWMRTNGWTYRIPNTADDLAYQSKVNAGYLEHKVETGEKPDGTLWTNTSVRVTPKGLLALAKAFPPPAALAS